MGRPTRLGWSMAVVDGERRGLQTLPNAIAPSCSCLEMQPSVICIGSQPPWGHEASSEGLLGTEATRIPAPRALFCSAGARASVQNDFAPRWGHFGFTCARKTSLKMDCCRKKVSSQTFWMQDFGMHSRT